MHKLRSTWAQVCVQSIRLWLGLSNHLYTQCRKSGFVHSFYSTFTPILTRPFMGSHSVTDGFYPLYTAPIISNKR